jgi:hypothetical protein
LLSLDDGEWAALTPEVRAEVCGCSVLEIMADDIVTARLDDLAEQQHRKPKQRRQRKPTISEKQLKAAKAAGASSVVAEKNGCRVEARFGEPSGADVITGDRSEWDELLQ